MAQRIGQQSRPLVVVLAGCNGAGKSTAALALLEGVLKVPHFLNGDDLAGQLKGVRGEAADWRASRLMLAEIVSLARRRQSFAFETTLAGRTTSKRLRWLAGQGYRSQVIFLWLPEAAMAVERVRSRASLGGHDVPEQTVIRRYHAGWVHFRTLILPIADNWRVYDNAGIRPRLIAFGCGRSRKRVKDEDAWQRFVGQRNDAATSAADDG